MSDVEPGRDEAMWWCSQEPERLAETSRRVLRCGNSGPPPAARTRPARTLGDSPLDAPSPHTRPTRALNMLELGVPSLPPQLAVLEPRAGYPSSCRVACPLPQLTWGPGTRGDSRLWRGPSGGERGLGQPPRPFTGRLQVLTTWGFVSAAHSAACPSIRPGPGRDGPEVVRHRCPCSHTPE